MGSIETLRDFSGLSGRLRNARCIDECYDFLVNSTIQPDLCDDARMPLFHVSAPLFHIPVVLCRKVGCVPPKTGYCLGNNDRKSTHQKRTHHQLADASVQPRLFPTLITMPLYPTFHYVLSNVSSNRLLNLTFSSCVL